MKYVWRSQPKSLWASDYTTVITIVAGTAWHYWASPLDAQALNRLLVWSHPLSSWRLGLCTFPG